MVHIEQPLGHKIWWERVRNEGTTGRYSAARAAVVVQRNVGWFAGVSR